MKLPPRPDEISVDIAAPSPPPRKSSLNPFSKLSPKPPPQPSFQTPSSPLKEEEEYVFEQPRELVTTLPPLTLTPSLQQTSFDSTPATRPPLKTHATEPPSTSNHDNRPTSPLSIASPVEAMNLEHNAWADPSEANGEQEVKMTFE